jgi:hypothetical protein
MSENQGNIFAGLGICWGLNLVQVGMAMLALVAGNYGLAILAVILAGFGVIQLAYIVPLYFLLKRRGKVLTARGLVIAASITVLLNSACDWTVFHR